MPQPSLPPRPVKIVRAGRAYNATYRQIDGRLFVDSAYGSNSHGVPIGKKDPKVMAERVLGEIVAQQTRF